MKNSLALLTKMHLGFVSRKLKFDGDIEQLSFRNAILHSQLCQVGNAVDLQGDAVPRLLAGDEIGQVGVERHALAVHRKDDVIYLYAGFRCRASLRYCLR